MGMGFSVPGMAALLELLELELALRSAGFRVCGALCFEIIRGEEGRRLLRKGSASGSSSSESRRSMIFDSGAALTTSVTAAAAAGLATLLLLLLLRCGISSSSVSELP
jgi:hypothetical protein